MMRQYFRCTRTVLREISACCSIQFITNSIWHRNNHAVCGPGNLEQSLSSTQTSGAWITHLGSSPTVKTILNERIRLVELILALGPHAGPFPAIPLWTLPLWTLPPRLALARKLGVVLHRIWVDGLTFRWTRPSPAIAG
jgi:hypothetical protein